MSNHIEVGTSTRHNQKIRSIVDGLTNIINQAEDLKEVLAQIGLDGNQALVVALDLSGPTAETDALAVQTALGSFVTEIQAAPFTQQLISRLG